MLPYDEKKMRLEKLYYISKGNEARSLNSAAELFIAQWQDVPQMMAEALKWIDETEKSIVELPEACKWIDLDKHIKSLSDDAEKTLDAEMKLLDELKALSDYREIYREMILRMYELLKASRQSHKNNDPIQTVLWFPVIEENYKLANRIWERINETEGSVKGGSNDKKRIWAQEVAEWLNDQYPKSKKKDAWKKIPEVYESREIKSDEVDYAIVYRGKDELGKDVLIAENTETKKISSIKKETFFKKYYKKGK